MSLTKSQVKCAKRWVWRPVSGSGRQRNQVVPRFTELAFGDVHPTGTRSPLVDRVAKRRAKNRVARRSRRINRGVRS